MRSRRAKARPRCANAGATWRESDLLGVGVYNSLQYLALATSTPLNVTLIAASTPIWMMVYGALFFDQRPRRRELLGAARSIAGVATVLMRGDWHRGAEVRFVPGDLLMLVATAGSAAYSWLLARPPQSMQPPRRPALIVAGIPVSSARRAVSATAASASST